MQIIKNNTGVLFNIKGTFSEEWFSNDTINNWEQDTFHILEHYKDLENGIYIDIGAWIGPTVLYSANIYNKVIAIEPDPVAIERLEENMSVNNFSNIKLVKKALSNKNGKSIFGGNGDLGNSESSLLIANNDFFTYEGRHTNMWKDNHNNIVEVETITIETLLDETNINPDEISLIKMDIEGGEVIVVPYLESFLHKYKPVFYISLHYCYLRINDITLILDILFGIYHKCYVFDLNGTKRLVNNKTEIIENQITTIVFEKT